MDLSRGVRGVSCVRKRTPPQVSNATSSGSRPHQPQDLAAVHNSVDGHVDERSHQVVQLSMGVAHSSLGGVELGPAEVAPHTGPHVHVVFHQARLRTHPPTASAIPTVPRSPRGYAALHGRRPFGYAATGRTQVFGSDGCPKLAPATGPHRSSQAFGRGSTGFRSAPRSPPRSPSKPDTRLYTPVRIPRQGPLQEPQDSAVLEQHPHKRPFKAL